MTVTLDYAALISDLRDHYNTDFDTTVPGKEFDAEIERIVRRHLTADKSQPLSGAAQPAPQPVSEFEKERAYCLAILDDLIPRIKSIAPPVAAFHVKIGLEVCRDRIATDAAAPVAVPAQNFVSDYSLPSCHVCGEMMKGVCPKCGTETGVTAAPLPPPQEPKIQNAVLAERKRCAEIVRKWAGGSWPDMGTYGLLLNLAVALEDGK